MVTKIRRDCYSRSAMDWRGLTIWSTCHLLCLLRRHHHHRRWDHRQIFLKLSRPILLRSTLFALTWITFGDLFLSSLKGISGKEINQLLVMLLSGTPTYCVFLALSGALFSWSKPIWYTILGIV